MSVSKNLHPDESFQLEITIGMIYNQVERFTIRWKGLQPGGKVYNQVE